MGDRVAVMRKGVLQQVDAPQTLYNRPANVFVGGFIGSPAMNMLEVRLERPNGHLVARLAETSLDLSDELTIEPAGARTVRRPNRPPGSAAREPRGRRARAARPPAAARRIRLRESLGSEVMAHIEVAAQLQRPTSSKSSRTRPAAGARRPERMGGTAVVVGRFDPRSPVEGR